MLHVKSFMRQWSYGPWLLAAGLVLGWVGEAAAEITLTVDKSSVREDDGVQEITVTATAGAATGSGGTVVALLLSETDATGCPTGDFAHDYYAQYTNDCKNWYDSRANLNAYFTITLPTIVIAEGATAGTGIVTLTPRNTDDRGLYDTYDDYTIPDDLKDGRVTDGFDQPRDSDGFHRDPYPDLVVRIGGVAGNGEEVNEAEIIVVDDDKLSSRLDLTFEPSSLSKEEGERTVTVTATLNGATLKDDHTFILTFSNASGVESSEYPVGFAQDTHRDSILTRDTDYDATPATLRLRRGEMKAKTTITIDPDNEPGYIVLRGRGATAEDGVITGIDLNLNGDKTDEIPLTTLSEGTTLVPDDNDSATNLMKIILREEGLGCSDTAEQHDLNFDGECNGAIREARVGIDLNGDGEIESPATSDGADNPTWTSSTESYFLWENSTDAESSALTEGTVAGNDLVLLEEKLEHKVTINPHFFEITDTPLAAADKLTATPAMIREEEGTRIINLTVTLKAPVSTREKVTFEIDALSTERDLNYTVSLGPELFIEAGETMGETFLTLTSVNDDDVNDPRTFEVTAKVGNAPPTEPEPITIVDDETLTDEITLTVDPSEIHAGEPADVTVTATLNGKTFDDAVTLTLIIDNDEGTATTAQRDTDYLALLRSFAIPAGEVRASTTVNINPISGGDKKVALKALETGIKNQDDETVSVTNANAVVTLKDAVATPDPDPDPPEPEGLAFDEDSVDPISGTVGMAITPVELPAASDGTAPLTYAVSDDLSSKTGLSFDAATRTISGTPAAETEGPVTIVYTVLDSEGESDALTFTIEIDEAPAPMIEVAELTSTHESIRENGETTAITLTVTLAEASATDEKVNFTLGAPSAGALAVRDVDYTAVLGGTITIAAGETTQTTTLILTPIDNPEVDGNKFLGVKAEAASGGSSKLKNIQISDDETPSTSISLEVSPDTVSEAAGETPITVTATLDGKERDADAEVIIEIDGASVATRDVDYSARFNPLLVIPAGLTSGRIVLFIDPIADVKDEGTETITLNGTIEGLMGGSTTITLSDSEEPEPEPEPELAFAEGTVIEDIEVTAGWEMKAVVLPAAEGGSGDISYSVSDLPAGLDWDAATRTISGTPDAATDGAVEVTYTATDGAGETAEPLTFSITVNAALDFGDFFSQFNGAGKVIPTVSYDGAEIRAFVVGQRVEDFVLPAGTGGTEPLTYSLSPALPAGLSFDAATRTISGTPMAEGEPVYTYVVTDANGASATMQLQTLPAAFALANNFPNPFNPVTTIQYALPEATDVKLTVYNVVGQPVRTLVAEYQSAGRYVVEWDATNDSGHSLSSGMYFYRLQAGGEFHAIKKMLLLK